MQVWLSFVVLFASFQSLHSSLSPVIDDIVLQGIESNTLHNSSSSSNEALNSTKKTTIINQETNSNKSLTSSVSPVEVLNFTEKTITPGGAERSYTRTSSPRSNESFNSTFSFSLGPRGKSESYGPTNNSFEAFINRHEMGLNITSELYYQCYRYLSIDDVCINRVRRLPTRHILCIHSCSHSKPKKPICCDFTGYSSRLVMTDFNIVDISNASRLHIELPVPRVRKVALRSIGSAHLSISPPGTQSTSITFLADATYLPSVPPFREVYLHDCKVHSMSDMVGLEHLHVQSSSIDEIRNISALRSSTNCNRTAWGSSSPPKLASVIAKNNGVSQMEDQASIRMTSIGSIENWVIGDLTITDTSIGFIYSMGLHQADGTITFSNVRIDHLHARAIVADHSRVHFTNVTIYRCDEPCFSIPKMNSYFDNVKINELYYTRAEGGPFRADNRTKVFDKKLPDNCTVQNNILELVCSFGHEMIPLQLKLAKVKPQNKIFISDHFDIDIIEGCYSLVTLRDIYGSYRSDGPFGSITAWCPETELVLHHVSLHTLCSRHVTRLEHRMIEERSTPRSGIKVLNLGTVKHFVTRRLTVPMVERLVYRPETVVDQFVYEDAVIEYLQKMVIHSQALFKNCEIYMIEKLIIDHDDQDGPPTIFDDVRFGAGEKGIHVVNGYLMLSRVFITTETYGMIYIERNGTVLVDIDARDLKYNFCRRKIAIISALFRAQVVFMGGVTPFWFWDCVKFREEPVEPGFFGEEFAEIIQNSSYIAIHSGNCKNRSGRDVDGRYAFCNMELIRPGTPVVLGESNDLANYSYVEVRNAEKLFVGRNCVPNMKFVNVTCAWMKSVPHSCFSNLHVINSTMVGVTNNLEYVEVVNSTVKEMHSTFVEAASILQSNILDIDIEVAWLNMSSCYVASVSNMAIHSEGEIVDSTLHVIEEGGITVKENGSLLMINTKIFTLNKNSITVFGTLTLVNVQLLTSAHPESIVLGPSGTLILKNTRIEDCNITEIGFVETGPDVLDEGIIVRDSPGIFSREFAIRSEMCGGHRLPQYITKGDLCLSLADTPNKMLNTCDTLLILLTVCMVPCAVLVVFSTRYLMLKWFNKERRNRVGRQPVSPRESPYQPLNRSSNGHSEGEGEEMLPMIPPPLPDRNSRQQHPPEDDLESSAVLRNRQPQPAEDSDPTELSDSFAYIPPVDPCPGVPPPIDTLLADESSGYAVPADVIAQNVAPTDDVLDHF